MFDIKLKEGRYFKNVDIFDEIIGQINNIECILDNADNKMEIYHRSDDNCVNLLAEITSDDIEYICRAYKHKECER